MFFDLQRKLTPAQRMAKVFEMVDFMRQFVTAQIRQTIRMQTNMRSRCVSASRRLDRETMIRAYSWDPAEHA